MRKRESGLTLIELLVAGVVLTAGLLGGMALIVTAMANDNRNKVDSSATILSQMSVETLSSVAANSTSVAAVVDCNPVVSSASHSMNTGTGTVGSSSGAPLTAGGDIDFSQAAVTNYSMSYYECQASTADRQAIYDVRWNIKQLNADSKLISVSARRANPITGGNYFSAPVTLKAIVGL